MLYGLLTINEIIEIFLKNDFYLFLILLSFYVLDFWTTVYSQNGDSNEKSVGRKLCPPMENVPQPINRVNTSAILHE